MTTLMICVLFEMSICKNDKPRIKLFSNATCLIEFLSGHEFISIVVTKSLTGNKFLIS